MERFFLSNVAVNSTKKAHRESLLNGLLARHTGFEPVALRLGAQEDSLKNDRLLRKNPQRGDFSHSICGNAGTRE